VTQIEEFPSNFMGVVKVVFERLDRVYGHIFHAHSSDITSVKDSLELSFKHFIFFTKNFKLISENELKPVELQISKLFVSDKLTSYIVKSMQGLNRRKSYKANVHEKYQHQCKDCPARDLLSKSIGRRIAEGNIKKAV